MKFANLVIGFVIFSVAVTIMFTAAKDMTSTFGSSSASDFNRLAGTYEPYQKNLTTQSDSAMRGMANQTAVGEASSTERSVFLLTGAVNSVKLIMNVFPTLELVLDTSQEEIGGLIPPIIFDAIIGILIVFILLVVVHMLMRMRSEV